MVGDMEKSKFREAWKHTRDMEREGHRTSGTLVEAALLQDRKTVTVEYLVS